MKSHRRTDFCCALPRDMEASISPLPEYWGVRECLLRRQPQIWQSLAERLQRNLSLLACQRCPYTEVNAVSKCQVAIWSPLHIKLVCPGKSRFFPVRSPDHHHDQTFRCNRNP